MVALGRWSAVCAGGGVEMDWCWWMLVMARWRVWSRWRCWVAHHHAGLVVAAAGGGEEGERERDEMPGPRGKWRLG